MTEISQRKLAEKANSRQGDQEYLQHQEDERQSGYSMANSHSLPQDEITTF